jgi:catechol 2,3-dioxygenase-like lactoylglutathione lyase family enzyme
MNTSLLGIHHVTAISSSPQRTVDFYSGVLGLKLVKRTVNFDDPGTYHLYFGDAVAVAGTEAFPSGGGASRASRTEIWRRGIEVCVLETGY